MKSRLLLNLLLLVCVSLVASYIFFSTSKPDTSMLSTLEIDSIEKIVISRPSRYIEFRKNNQDWYMTKPYEIKAHNFRVNHILKILNQISNENYEADTLDLSQYKLDPANASLYFNDHEIRFGNTNPVSGKRYLLSDNQVHLLFEDVYTLISAQATSFIDLNLIDTNSLINQIKTTEWNITRSTDDGITTPDSISQVSAEQLFQHWQTAEAFAVHKYLKRKQLGQIEVTLNDRVIIFEISDDDPWLILARPDLGIEYHLDSAFKLKLLEINDA